MKHWRFVPLVVALAGCADAVASTSGVGAPVPESIATLDVSGSTERVGGVVTFTARLTSASVGRRAGAYAARIEYDPTAVAYLDDGGAPSGLVAFHAADGVLRVAGASIDGYADGVLFNARFRVTRAAPGAELRLVIDELRDVSASDRLPAALATRTAVLQPWK